jgi:type IV secretory pathway VirB3-like protein
MHNRVCTKETHSAASISLQVLVLNIFKTFILILCVHICMDLCVCVCLVALMHAHFYEDQKSASDDLPIFHLSVTP